VATSLDLVRPASRSLKTILEVADHVGGRALRPEVARTVKGLFDLLAWSDGRLDDAEVILFDRLCAELPTFGELTASLDDYAPTDPTFGVIPPLLTAVVAHDRRTGERLAPMLVTSLETLGYAIIGVGGAPIDVEKAELRTYIDGLRSLSRMLTTAPSGAPLDGPEPLGLKA
jgi:hypothetical protein